LRLAILPKPLLWTRVTARSTLRHTAIANKLRQGAKLDMATAQHEYGTSYALKYTFPRRDVYAAKLVAEPKEGAQFKAFDLLYDIRVELGEDIVVEDGPNLLVTPVRYLPLALIAVVLAGILIRKRLSLR
jgi:hypothetical protein